MMQCYKLNICMFYEVMIIICECCNFSVLPYT